MVAAFRGEFGAGCRDAMSLRGAFGSRMPLASAGGIEGDRDGDMREMVYEDMRGELYEEGVPPTDPVDE